jgi:hypothetical protein
MQLLVDVLNSSWELHLIIADHDNLSAQGRMEKLNSVFLGHFLLSSPEKVPFPTLVALPIFRHSVS